MTPETPPPDRTSWGPSPRSSRVMPTLAIIGLISLFAGSTIVLKSVGVIGWSILDLLSDSDEAPIRVRNGSIDLNLDSSTQKWAAQGASGNYRIPGARRHKEEFEVIVVPRNGAVCPALVGTGPDVVLTFSDDKVVRLQSAGFHTVVKPENGATLTWNASAPQMLRYMATGHIKSVAVGSGANPPVVCSFTTGNQLDRINILNTP